MAKPPWLGEREQRVWQGYLHLNRDLFAVLEQQLAGESGLSGADYRVLHPLSVAPGGLLRARDLGSQIGWDHSRLSHHLSRNGKARTCRPRGMRRGCSGLMVRLTTLGRRAIEEAAPGHADAVRRYFFDQLSKDEIETMAAVFDRVLDKDRNTSGCGDRHSDAEGA